MHKVIDPAFLALSLDRLAVGRSGMALPREHDEFLRSKAPALR